MTIDNSDIDGAKQVVTRAIEKYNADRAGLLASDGKTPIYPPDVHTAKVAKLLESVEWAVERATTLADKVTADIEAQRLQPFSDPTSALSAADLQDANARAVWVREDCESLPLGDLAERLRAVHASGSKASVFVHDRYSKRRWQVESAKTPQPPDLVVLGETLRDLGILGPRAGLSDEAQKRQEAAAALKRWAGRELSIARDPEKDKADRAKSAAATRAMF